MDAVEVDDLRSRPVSAAAGRPLGAATRPPRCCWPRSLGGALREPPRSACRSRAALLGRSDRTGLQGSASEDSLAQGHGRRRRGGGSNRRRVMDRSGEIDDLIDCRGPGPQGSGPNHLAPRPAPPRSAAKTRDPDMADPCERPLWRRGVRREDPSVRGVGNPPCRPLWSGPLFRTPPKEGSRTPLRRADW